LLSEYGNIFELRIRQISIRTKGQIIQRSLWRKV